jgi:large subunit ribosomal protein L23
MTAAYSILRRPIVTEKTTLQKELANTVTFEVDRGANRIDIKRAVEKAFGVKVQSVQTMQVTGKVKRRGAILGKRRNWKKAMVRLMPGERIEFFEGV